MPSYSNIVSAPLIDTLNPGSTSVYALASELPLSANSPGEFAYVQETGNLYVWNNGWYSIAIVNTAPSITSGADATYSLATDGTPIVLTLSANDPEGIPITWSYNITSGSLTNGGGTTATVSNVDNVFTITPSTVEAYAGTFSITFIASDGVNVGTATSQFTLSFGLQWTLLHTLDNPNAYSTSQDDYFGNRADIYGNYALVATYFEDDAGGGASGIAYIFDVTTGSLLYTLNDPNPYGTSAYDFFGYDAAIYGTKAAISAYQEDDAGGTDSGKVYVYNVSTGSLLYTLNDPNAYGTTSNDWFGYSVDISDSYIIAGAWYEGDAGATAGGSGKAYIFSASSGSLLFTLNNPNAYSTSQGDYFGIEVAVHGTRAVVGAYQEDDAGGTGSGKAYVYNASTGSLLYTLDNPNAYSTSASDGFGRYIDLNTSYIAVGVPNEDADVGSGAGKIYVFNLSDGSLRYTLSNPETSGGFGSVRIYNDYLISSSSSNNRVYIFDIATGDVLSTIDNPNAYSTSTGDSFGSQVSMNGNYLIVSASSEDDAGGTESGKAYIFEMVV